MLQKVKYETLNFGKYSSLRQKFIQPDFDPKDEKRLHLNGFNAD